jgi:hypothetical protein
MPTSYAKATEVKKLRRAGPSTPEGFERMGKAQTKTVSPGWPASVLPSKQYEMINPFARIALATACPGSTIF